MRSIPYAMTWELLRRGRWHMLSALLAANLLSLLLLTALRMDGALDPSDSSLIMVQMVLIQFQTVFFAAALFASIDLKSCNYVLPVPTSTLVAWKMIPAMVLIFVECIASTLALNWLFGLRWPFWGPALLSAASVAMILAALWYSERSIFLPFCISFGAAIIGLWYKSRWGPMFSLPTHVWENVTLSEATTLLLFVIISYFVAVNGVTRSRRGDTLGADGTWMWVDNILNWTFDIRVDRELRFASPQEAHYWSEWTKKGWLLPVIVSFCLFIGLAGWTVFSRNPKDMMEGLIAGGAMLSAMGMLGGIVIGNTGPADADYEMGSFIGTRPLTDRDLSTITLKVIAKSVLVSWVIWAVAFAGVTAIQWATGDLTNSLTFWNLRWWYLPVTLLGAWTANSVIASLSLSGSSSMWVKTSCVVFASYVAVGLSSKLLDYQSRAWLIGVTMVLTGVALGTISILVVASARRRSLIAPRIAMMAIGIWLALSAGIIAESIRLFIPASAVVLLIGIASLAVTPLAAAPLAVNWNRHR